MAAKTQRKAARRRTAPKKSAEPQDLEIVYRAVDDLIPYARNSRTHSAEQIAEIAGSIREFNFTNPILTDGSSTIIAGHARVMAAQKLGIKRVPCVELAHLTELQRRAYVIADNKLALNAGWDFEMLPLEIAGLIEAGYDASLTGFSAAEVESLLDAMRAPSLDSLAQTYGDHDEESFWPRLELALPPALMERYVNLTRAVGMRPAAGGDPSTAPADWQRFGVLLACVDEAALASTPLPVQEGEDPPSDQPEEEAA